MAGIMANSSSVTMVAGDTAVDKIIGGFVDDEQITLTTSPAGTVYAWTISWPSGASSRSGLSEDDAASVTFTPEREGEYFVQCVVDGTSYSIRMTVIALAIVNSTQTTRYFPTTDASVPTPLSGGTDYWSSDQSGRVYKNSAGTVVKFADEATMATTYLALDGSNSPSDDIDWDQNLITNLQAIEVGEGTVATSGNIATSAVSDIITARNYAGDANVAIIGLETGNWVTLGCANEAEGARIRVPSGKTIEVIAGGNTIAEFSEASGLDLASYDFATTGAATAATFNGAAITSAGAGTLALMDDGAYTLVETGLVAVRKASVGTIAKGAAVYAVSYNDGAGYLEVEEADADSVLTMPTCGIAAEALTNSSTGTVRVGGILSDVDTSAWSTGDLLYTSRTTGQLTSTTPIGLSVGKQAVAKVVRSHAVNGSMMINIDSVAMLPQFAAATRVWESDANGTPQEVDPANRWAPAAHQSTHVGGSDPIPVATVSTDGLMSAADKTALGNVAGVTVRKGSAGTLLKGSPVYESGYNIGLSVVEVEAADADNATARPAIGLAASDITNAADAIIISYGVITGVDTSAFAATDALYVSTTPGALTNVKPDGTATGIQRIGQVLRSHPSNGAILVMGAGRTNDIPQMSAADRIWRSDVNGTPQEVDGDTLWATVTAPADITGSRGGNVALANLLTALAAKGLITDSTT